MTTIASTKHKSIRSVEAGAVTPATRRGRPPKSAAAETGDRRTQILEAARKRFAKVGFLGTTVRQIADDVNILSGSLYHHFTNKDEMLNEIISDTVVRLRDTACEIAARPDSAESRLASLIHANLADLKNNPDVHAILFREREFFRNRKEFDYVVNAKKAGYNAWESILRDGIREGAFRADLDTFLTISTTVRMLNSAADWFGHEDGSVLESPIAYPVDAVAGFYVDFILQAIRRVDRVGEPVPRVA